MCRIFGQKGGASLEHHVFTSMAPNEEPATSESEKWRKWVFCFLRWVDIISCGEWWSYWIEYSNISNINLFLTATKMNLPSLDAMSFYFLWWWFSPFTFVTGGARPSKSQEAIWIEYTVSRNVGTVSCEILDHQISTLSQRQSTRGPMVRTGHKSDHFENCPFEVSMS